MQSLIIVLVIAVGGPAFGIDIVNIEKGISDKDIRTLFKKEVIETALQHSVSDFGAYKINVKDLKIPVERAMLHLERGGSINTYIGITTEDWERKTTAIKIPIRRGLISYRLLVIHREDAHLFHGIKDVDDLRALKVGLLRGWVTTSIFKSSGFKMEVVNSFDGMFKMLSERRFHFTVRGVNEVFDELDQRKFELENLMIEPNIALYIPSASYIFVSPKAPRLAQRLTLGLSLMVDNGALEKIFQKYFAADIEKAGLANRRVIAIENPLLPETVPMNEKHLWFSVSEELTTSLVY